MIKRLTPAQYLSLLNSKESTLPDNVELIVSGDVEIPSGIKRLPNVKTIFDGNVVSVYSDLEYFNGIVRGDTFFEDVETLKKIGPDACFSGLLNVRGCALKEFNNTVGGGAIFDNCSSLICIGKNAWFGRDISLTGTNVSHFNSSVGGPANFFKLHSLKEIGADAKFGGTVNASGTSIEKFDNCVKGNAIFNGCKNLREIGPNTNIEGILNIIDTKVRNVDPKCASKGIVYERKFTRLKDVGKIEETKDKGFDI